MIKKTLSVLGLFVLTIAMIGCNAQSAATKVSGYLVAILNIAQAEEAALPQQDAAIVTAWVNLGLNLDGQLNTCLAASGNTKSKIVSCFGSFSAGLLSPSELAQLRILSPAAQHSVQIVATAAVIAVNVLLADWNIQAQPQPVIAQAPATDQELHALSAKLEAAGYPVYQ